MRSTFSCVRTEFIVSVFRLIVRKSPILCVRARCICLALVRSVCSWHGIMMCMSQYVYAYVYAYVTVCVCLFERVTVCACSFTYLVHVPATPPHRPVPGAAQHPRLAVECPCRRGSARSFTRTTSAWRGRRFTTPCSSAR